MSVEAQGDYGTYYYIDSASSSEVLSTSEMQANALYFYSYCSDKKPTWTLEAISAMLGNIQSEGIMNPAQWEYGYNKSRDHGYGMVQWTPASKYLDWCDTEGKDRLAIDTVIERFQYEIDNGIQWIATGSYNYSFSDFVTSTDATATLASAWLYNYERPGDPSATESTRRSQAESWYTYLSGEEPTPPEPVPPTPTKKSKGLGIMYYHQYRYD